MHQWSQRGGDILVDDLHAMYNKQGTNSNVNLIYWVSTRRPKHCKTRLHSKIEMDDYKIVNHVHDHNNSWV